MGNKKRRMSFAGRTMRCLAVMAMALMMVIPMIAVPADAASNLTVTGGDSVAGGETFTVTVTYSGDSVGRVSGGMTYDTSMLTYISGGSSTGNTGWVQLDRAGTGEDITFTVKFQALKEGTTAVNVETSEIFNLDEMYMDPPAGVSKNIAISGNAADDQLVEPETIPEEEVEPDMIGVDEKEGSVNTMRVLGIGAAVAAILIVVIAIVIRRKK